MLLRVLGLKKMPKVRKNDRKRTKMVQGKRLHEPRDRVYQRYAVGTFVFVR